MKKVIFSGIQPSGNLHIGNYIGAIQQWVKLQNDVESNELIFCIVDLHAITVYQDPKVLRQKICEVAALYIACGIDPQKSHIFVQSENPDHSYLAWIFDCITPIGWLNRMTQFKDKSQKQKESTSAGLFNYPALMAADIVLYDTNLVPVGEDQTQHIEITTDIAERFNRLYTPLFILPQAFIDKDAARIMSLQNPSSKMSKSDNNPLGMLNLLDSRGQIEEKIQKAVTDSGSEIIYRNDKPALSNLLVIYSKLAGKSIGELEKKYRGVGYAEFKRDLIEVVDRALGPIQTIYHKLMSDSSSIDSVLDRGRDFSLKKSSKKLQQVKRVMGLGR